MLLSLLTTFVGCASPELAYKNSDTEARWRRLERALMTPAIDPIQFIGQQVAFDGGLAGYGPALVSLRVMTGPEGSITVYVDRSTAARSLSRATAECLNEVEAISAPIVNVSVSGVVTSIDSKRRIVYLAPHLIGVTSSF
jgi:hypothetical protein